MKKLPKELLYFEKINGEGNLKCNDCGYSSIILASMYNRTPANIFEGFENKSVVSSNLGCQCQLCGRLEIFVNVAEN